MRIDMDKDGMDMDGLEGLGAEAGVVFSKAFHWFELSALLYGIQYSGLYFLLHIRTYYPNLSFSYCCVIFWRDSMHSWHCLPYWAADRI